MAFYGTFPYSQVLVVYAICFGLQISPHMMDGRLSYDLISLIFQPHNLLGIGRIDSIK